MAQVTISEEHYQELLTLAQARGVTADALADEFIQAQVIAADQRAFWGDIHEELAQAEAELASRPPRYLTEEEFFAELEAPAAQKDPSDTDV